MAWITPADITAVYSDASVTTAFIAHVQSLAEVCIGAQTEPVSAQLKATFIDIAYRKSRDVATNPDGVTQTQLGAFMEATPGAPGLGLTKTDCKNLKRAIGRTGLWVQPTTRGDVETAAYDDPDDPFDNPNIDLDEESD